MTDCSNGHVCDLDTPSDHVRCICGQVEARLEEMSEDYARLSFTHADSGEPYHLTRFILRMA